MSELRQCALWFYVYGGLYVEMFNSESEAASYAHSREDEGTASVKGVQYDDGAFVDCDDWPAFKTEGERRRKLWEDEMKRDRGREKPPKRTVNAPWGDDKTTVSIDAPEWLGRPK